MRKRFWVLGLALLVSLGLAALVIPVRRGAAPVRIAPPSIEPLADRRDLVGDWDRVEFPEAVRAGNWRKFSPTGEMRVRYGDAVYWGTYKFIDADTVETRDGHDGKLNRWTVGSAGGKLVLIHQSYGWVEQYVKVPTGSLQP